MIRGAFLILHHDDRTGHDAGRRKAIGRALITGISTGQGSARITEQIMQAAQIPERRALLIARTEVNRAYRQSNRNQMRSSRAVLGYRRMCCPDTACFACLMLDKEFYPIDSEPCNHPNGKCSFVPVTRHYDPGNDPGWQGGREYFDSLPEDAQRKLMGPGRFDLWKQGGVDPRDMVWIKPNQTWGGSPAIKPVQNLQKSNVYFHSDVSISNQPKYITEDQIRDLTKDFTARGWEIRRGKEAEENLKMFGEDKTAAFLSGFNIAYIKDKATISEVLEEMFHGEQEYRGDYSNHDIRITVTLREIDAQKYIINSAEKYNIPKEEVDNAVKCLQGYERDLKYLQDLLNDHDL